MNRYDNGERTLRLKENKRRFVQNRKTAERKADEQKKARQTAVEHTEVQIHAERPSAKDKVAEIRHANFFNATLSESMSNPTAGI